MCCAHFQPGSSPAGKLSSLPDTIHSFSEPLTAASLPHCHAAQVDDASDSGIVMREMNDVTLILQQIDSGDPSAAEKLLPLVYDELRKLAAARMAAESPDHTLQATALVHEA